MSEVRGIKVADCDIYHGGCAGSEISCVCDNCDCDFYATPDDGQSFAQFEAGVATEGCVVDGKRYCEQCMRIFWAGYAHGREEAAAIDNADDQLSRFGR